MNRLTIEQSNALRQDQYAFSFLTRDQEIGVVYLNEQGAILGWWGDWSWEEEEPMNIYTTEVFDHMAQAFVMVSVWSDIDKAKLAAEQAAHTRRGFKWERSGGLAARTLRLIEGDTLAILGRVREWPVSN